MASVADVRAVSRTGEFDDPPVTDAMVTAALAEAALHLNARAWGERYDTGLALLAAHLLLDGAAGGVGSPIKGAVVQESLGPASRAYAQSLVKVQDDVLNLNGTTYGRRYLALRGTLILGPLGIYESP